MVRVVRRCVVSKLWVGVGWISVVVTVLFFWGGLLVVCGIGVVVSGVGISMCSAMEGMARLCRSWWWVWWSVGWRGVVNLLMEWLLLPGVIPLLFKVLITIIKFSNFILFILTILRSRVIRDKL
jgi:hypothetical protein